LSDSGKVAIVAAIEREIWPLVKSWTKNKSSSEGRTFTFFENDNMVAVCGGIGAEAARRTSEAVIKLYNPAIVVSAGFAGALDPALEIGQTFTARYVIDARDGSRSVSGIGDRVLISFPEIADVQQKAKIAESYGADAVDMEAAAVARSAEAHGIKFVACKAISDTSGSWLPPLARFVRSDGSFHMLRFVAYVAVRPWVWFKVQRLARDSAVAADKLCEKLAQRGDFQPADTRVLAR
jgi:adenosylhomocysteine nucleosidase